MLVGKIYFSRPSAAPRSRNGRLAPVTPGPEKRKGLLEPSVDVESIQQWFAKHVTLDGKPYTLDFDQARAVCDEHKNTLVTARAGSGKTRVIVAKVAYLVSRQLADLNEIAIFMFNRAAAAEVNERIAQVQIDKKNLARGPVTIASTFHKFALNIVKSHGEKPQILTEIEHEDLVRDAFNQALARAGIKLPPCDYQEVSSIVNSFIARAGQKYPSLDSITHLKSDIDVYINQHQTDSAYARNIFLHKISFLTYQVYLSKLSSPQTDFNLLMSHASKILHTEPQAKSYIGTYKYLMIDEYQDFSYLFYAMISALRHLHPEVKIFAVGDDWQAINRFAGSDVDYFINFQKYFPDDYINIPLATNYRSCRKIVEYANDYMIKHYDQEAIRAVPFSRKPGRIRRIIQDKIKYDPDDYLEDGLEDGRFMRALLQNTASGKSQTVDQKALKTLAPAAKLLKTIYKIFTKHPHSEIMLLHRHNFTSIPGVTLKVLLAALQNIVIEEGIMTAEAFSTKVRCMTMHKSKGLESEIVILLEMDPEIIKSHHPHATLFEIFGDTLATESADQDRLIYVALTRAKKHLYLVSSAKSSLLS